VSARGRALRVTARGSVLRRLAVAILLLGQAAHADVPRSAIPWLSQSLDAAEAPPVEPLSPRRDPLETEPIDVAPIEATNRNALGILPPGSTGFARELWGPTDVETVRDLVLSAPSGGVPEARALFLRLLLAEADPPSGEDPGSELLLARIDRLLEAGALQQADALIYFANPEDPELFRRWFDISLLTNNAEPACEALRLNPSLSPTMPARVFCIARGGDWNAAEITLTLGREIGSIPPDQEALIARFLDPEIFEGEPPPPVPDPLTPLAFLMREAVGLPRPPNALPLAFLYPDLEEHAPMRTRITAAERLVDSGAIGPGPLFAAYRSGEPAASGGVWDRAAAIQALDAALSADDAAEIAPALEAADAAMARAELRTAFADAYHDRFAELPPEDVGEDTRAQIFELLLLADDLEAALGFEPATLTARQQAVRVALDPDTAAPAPRTDDPYAAAVLAAFSESAPESHMESGLVSALAEGREGEVILKALDLLADGAGTAPPSLEMALRILRQAGQDSAARRIAAQTLLAGQ
jgi:hypothetical protein